MTARDDQNTLHLTPDAYVRHQVDVALVDCRLTLHQAVLAALNDLHRRTGLSISRIDVDLRLITDVFDQPRRVYILNGIDIEVAGS